MTIFRECSCDGHISRKAKNSYPKSHIWQVKIECLATTICQHAWQGDVQLSKFCGNKLEFRSLDGGKRRRSTACVKNSRCRDVLRAPKSDASMISIWRDMEHIHLVVSYLLFVENKLQGFVCNKSKMQYSQELVPKPDTWTLKYDFLTDFADRNHHLEVAVDVGPVAPDATIVWRSVDDLVCPALPGKPRPSQHPAYPTTHYHHIKHLRHALCALLQYVSSCYKPLLSLHGSVAGCSRHALVLSETNRHTRVRWIIVQTLPRAVNSLAELPRGLCNSFNVLIPNFDSLLCIVTYPQTSNGTHMIAFSWNFQGCGHSVALFEKTRLGWFCKFALQIVCCWASFALGTILSVIWALEVGRWFWSDRVKDGLFSIILPESQGRRAHSAHLQRRCWVSTLLTWALQMLLLHVCLSVLVHDDGLYNLLYVRLKQELK